jgi:hypothetical protein
MKKIATATIATAGVATIAIAGTRVIYLIWAPVTFPSVMIVTLLVDSVRVAV